MKWLNYCTRTTQAMCVAYCDTGEKGIFLTGEKCICVSIAGFVIAYRDRMGEIYKKS